MEKGKYSVEQIAQWFINRGKLSAQLTEDNTALISPLKLQKLLYYAQACSLSVRNKKLFDEKIKAWQHGPVVEKIYHKYKPCHKNGIDYVEPVEIDEETAVILEFVFSKFGQYSAEALVNLTHSDFCWSDADRNDEIPVSDMQKCFTEKWKYLVDLDEKEREYSNMAETNYINSLGELADYLKESIKNQEEDVVDIDWKKCLDTK